MQAFPGPSVSFDVDVGERRSSTLERFVQSTERDLDYLSLKESILLHLERATSRSELVLTGQDLREVV